MSLYRWSRLRSSDFPAPPDAVAVVPVGAVEQHGPHLPLGTDHLLAEALAERGAAQAQTARVYLMPTLSLGVSEEHHDWPGTLTLETEQMIAALMAVARGVASAGIAKLVFINGHGGNIPALHTAVRRARIRHDLFASTLGWMALGIGDHPEGARIDDIHGGFLETAAMLHLHPDLVDMGEARDFVSANRTMAETYAHLRFLGAVSTGWTARDLHAEGAAGNAAAASAEAGKVIVETAAARLGSLFDEIAAHQPDWSAP
jgi:creatinine amidohydrolase